MPVPLIFACLWALLACVAGMGPERFMWPAAWTLIFTGIPLLGWVTYAQGPVWGLVLLLAGASVLRWPLIRAGRALHRTARSPLGDEERSE